MKNMSLVPAPLLMNGFTNAPHGDRGSRLEGREGGLEKVETEDKNNIVVVLSGIAC